MDILKNIKKITKFQLIKELLDVFRDEGHDNYCNYHMKFHIRSDYICECGYDDLFPTAEVENIAAWEAEEKQTQEDYENKTGVFAD